jgi:hypothetical protein
MVAALVTLSLSKRSRVIDIAVAFVPAAPFGKLRAGLRQAQRDNNDELSVTN